MDVKNIESNCEYVFSIISTTHRPISKEIDTSYGHGTTKVYQPPNQFPMLDLNKATACQNPGVATYAAMAAVFPCCWHVLVSAGDFDHYNG
jgi:hypothetical protein